MFIINDFIFLSLYINNLLSFECQRVNNSCDILSRSYLFKIILFLIRYNKIKDGTTIKAVMIKNKPQLPFSISTKLPDDEAKVVLPAVPIDASKAY